MTAHIRSVDDTESARRPIGNQCSAQQIIGLKIGEKRTQKAFDLIAEQPTKDASECCVGSDHLSLGAKESFVF